MSSMENSRWQTERLFFGGDAFFSDLENGLDHAQKSVDFEMYIFDKGIVGDRIASALIRAADRGVRVRLLLDGIGASHFPWTYESELVAHGVKIRYFRLYPWTRKPIPGETGNPLRRVYFRLRRLNKGTHRKYVLIDDTVLWVSTMNISDHHAKTIAGEAAWKDLAVRVTGAETDLARRAFHRAFRRGLTLRLKPKVAHLLLISQGYLQSRKIRNVQQRRLRDARQRIWIQTPYFVPLNRVFWALAKKAKEGVDVRIIVPRKNDVWIIQWMSYSYLFALCRLGVKVYEYTPRFAHEKVYLIDDWICIGSSNLNHRSFIHDLEMDIVITHDGNKRELVDDFLSCERHSRQLNEGIFEKLPLWKRFFSEFLKLFSYWS